MRFDEIKFEQELLDGLDAMCFEEMTPVQEQAMPLILEGKDLIACAQTGTGKTAAYLLPLINNLLTNNEDNDKVRAIVMAPTRELAQQIDQQMEGISYFVPVTSVAVYGGNDKNAWDTQKNAMQNATDVLISTPGRLLQHLTMGNVDLSGVKYFILDEADRMLDMGFYEDILSIVKYIPKDRQTVMFSATMPPKIRKLAETIMKNPAKVDISISKPAEGIHQSAFLCYEPQKVQLICKLTEERSQDKTIIFSSSKQKVKDVYHTLARQGLKIKAMHSDLEQAERDEVMLDFKSGKITALIATDIVARGIDIDGIDLVVNYDVPRDAEDYIHRIGRTARAKREGYAVTFVSVEDQRRFRQIEKFLEKEIDKEPMPEEFGEAPEYSVKSFSKFDKNDKEGHNRRDGGFHKNGSRNRNSGRRHYRSKDNNNEISASLYKDENTQSQTNVDKKSDDGKRTFNKHRNNRRHFRPRPRTENDQTNNGNSEN